MESLHSSTQDRNLANNDDLIRFLSGSVAEPEERINRGGACDYRYGYRPPRPAAEIWRSAIPKVKRIARIRIKASKFKYEPISGQQIRLLHIRRGRYGEDLECDLRAKSLTEVKGSYEALSYCWGMDEPSEVIFVNQWQLLGDGQTFSQKRAEFPIRPNLLNALRHLRSEYRGVLVWVDAICIDQRDTTTANAEKNEQLSMMSDIYSSAKNVCIWFGDSDETSVEALKLVNTITDLQMLDTYLRVTDDATEKQWRHFVRILKETQWFSRRWIIQEIASARNASVHCGNSLVHWDDLADAISLLLENYEVLAQKFGEMDVFAEVPSLSAVQLVEALPNVCRKSPTGESTEHLLDLETLVCTFQQFQARFPEDIIHSVRALAKDVTGKGENDGFSLCANGQTSTRDLFIAFVRRCISNSGSLDIICRHWAPPVVDARGKEVKLPSWVSGLANGPFGLPGESHERQNGENFVAMSSTDKRKRYNASQDWGRGIYSRPSSSPRDSDLPTPVPHSSTNRNSDLGSDLRTMSPTQPMLNRDKSHPSPAPEAIGTEPRNITQKTSQPSPLLPVTPERSSIDNYFARESTTLEFQQAAAQTDKSNGVNEPSEGRPFDFLYTPGSRRSNTDPNDPKQHTFEHLELPRNAVKPGWVVEDDKEHIKDLSEFMTVEGFVLGSVKSFSDLMRDGIVPGDWLQKLGWEDKAIEENQVPEPLWRTLVADRNMDGGNPPSWYKRACLHCLKDARLINRKGDLNTRNRNQVIDSMTSKYLRRVESVIWRRRIVELCSMEFPNGNIYYGLAPEGTKQADTVCILVGCSVPVVLRKVTDDTSRINEDEEIFELIGEAYIHGKMDGEAVQNREVVDSLKRLFILQ